MVYAISMNIRESKGEHMKNITILGAGGFIGTNLALRLSQSEDIHLTLVDRNEQCFSNIYEVLTEDKRKNTSFVSRQLDASSSFNDIVDGQDIIYHLVSTTNPSTSNQSISRELSDNVIMTNNLLEACVKHPTVELVFLSSGGTVYGKTGVTPIKEDAPTNPINSYGLQKVVIEKMLYMYHYMYGLEYRVIRLSNPYGPYQRPNGIQGVVTTFIYKSLHEEPISVYGDGSTIRDYIYIDDAIEGIIKIANLDNDDKVYNLGSGTGHSINDIIEIIKSVINTDIHVQYSDMRKVDVPINILNVEKYTKAVGECKFVELKDGILKTIDFFRKQTIDLN